MGAAWPGPSAEASSSDTPTNHLAKGWSGRGAFQQLLAPGRILSQSRLLVRTLLTRRGASLLSNSGPSAAEGTPSNGPLTRGAALGSPTGDALADGEEELVATFLQAETDLADEAASVPRLAEVFARHGCRLLQGEAAWVYAVEADDGTFAVLSSHLEPTAQNRADRLAEEVQEQARDVALAMASEEAAETRAPQPILRGDYVGLPLISHHRIHGLLMVRLPARGSPISPLRVELLASLARHVAAELEVDLLRGSQRDLAARITQLGVHRTDYVATLSHELRTPLTSIKGFAQLLMRGGDVPATVAQSYAAAVASEADRLDRIIDDVVELTRMETGLLEFRCKPTCLGRLVRNVVETLYPKTPSRHLSVKLPDRLPSVRGDPERLTLVLGRLLLDAMGRSYLDAAISVEVEVGEEEVRVLLDYQTTDAQMERLLRALELPGQRSTDGQATRLGRGDLHLYISKNFIEAHGGRMWVETRKGSMARVAFALPRWRLP